MPGGVDRLAHFGDRRHTACRSLVMQNGDGLDLLLFVFAQFRFDGFRVRAGTPVAFDEPRHDAKLFGHLLPERAELTCLEHQDVIAGRKRIHERRFPRAGA